MTSKKSDIYYLAWRTAEASFELFDKGMRPDPMEERAQNVRPRMLI